MNTRLALLLALTAVANCDSRPSSFYGVPQVSHNSSERSSENRGVYSRDDRSDEDSAEYGPAKYDFDWDVRHDYSGNDFGHQENRDNDFTQGSYYVYLPDTRLQTVIYYVAEINYEGEAQHPESKEYRVSRRRYSSQDSHEVHESSESHSHSPSRFYGYPH